LKRLCVFCGSSAGSRPAYAEAARRLGEALARRGVALVYGGSRIGLMGILADSVLAAGGHAIGVIPQMLVDKEVAHESLPDLRVVGSMHERKALMAELADGFLAMPGGYGTFEEFFEALTWLQLGMHPKPCALLNLEGYYDPLLALLDRAVQDRFLRPSNRELALAGDDIEALLDRMAAFRAPGFDKWIEPRAAKPLEKPAP
jgi:uncharacterized protein (TIGR00730 family)